AGMVADGQEEHHVDELADGGGVLDFHQAFQVDGRLVAAAFQVGVAFQLVDDVDDALFLAGVEAAGGVGDGLGRGDHGGHLLDAQEVAQVVESGEVARVGQGDDQVVVAIGQGQDLVDG